MPPIVVQRRFARRLALQALYQWQISGDSPRKIEREAQARRDYAKADQEYFHRLFLGITADIERLNRQIIQCTDINAKDLQEFDILMLGILHIAVYELLSEHELNASIIINEAILLSKDFLHDGAHGYIHSILDDIVSGGKQKKTPAAPDEWQAIETIKEIVNKDALPLRSCVLPIGDDCACLQTPSSDEVFSFSTDSFCAQTHFPLESPPFLVGYRTLNAAASDLAAMGARPLGFLLALNLAESMRQAENLTELAKGMRLAALRTRLRLLGGNLVASDTTSLTFTVIGSHPNKNSLLRRGTAREGDSLFVSGHLGGAAAGLGVAQKSARELSVKEAALRAAYFCPQARLELGQALVGIASSCIDLSDGMASDLLHLLRPLGANNASLGARIFVDRLPLPLELEATEENKKLALTGGDDYELLFTAAPKETDRIAHISSQLGVPVSHIGEITTKPAIVCCKDNGDEYPLSGRGYTHF